MDRRTSGGGRVYDLFKFLHVLAAMVWIGAGLTFQIMNGRLARAGDEAGIAAMASQAAFFGKAVFSPAAGTTLVAGIVAVLTSNGAWGFGDLWITWGFAGVLLSIVFGAVLSERAGKDLATEVETGGGAASPRAAELQRRLGLFGVIDLLVLVSVVAAMVWKPGA